MSAAATMTAVELDRRLHLTLVERELAEPGPDEVLVRVEWAGLCGSDLHVMAHGTWVEQWPAVLGHELCGIVEAAGEATGVAPGTRIVADSRVPCRGCAACAAGAPDRCAQPAFVGEAFPGGFATHCVLPAALVHAVPEGLDPATAVLAEPLAVALHALGHVPGDGAPARILILGHGPIGALVHVEARRRWPEAEIAVAEPAPLRAALARALGAEVAASSGALRGGAAGAAGAPGAGATGSAGAAGSAGSAGAASAASAAGAAGPAEAGAPDPRFDLVIDAAGYRGSLADAVAAAAVGAHVLVVALSEEPVALSPIELAERRLRLIGCNAFVDELPQAIERLAQEPWRYRPVVTEAVTLAELPALAARQLQQPDAVKVLVRP